MIRGTQKVDMNHMNQFIVNIRKKLHNDKKELVNDNFNSSN